MGGYLGEVAKAGTYKAIVWAAHEGRVYGQVLVAKLGWD